MARLPRLYAPGLPHLVHAGFAQPLAAPDASTTPLPTEVLDALTDWLGTGAAHYRVAVHGWVLLADRMVLLATPNDDRGLSRLIQSLGRNLAARLRRGRVFTGRYRSALIEPGAWVLPALLWLETLAQRQSVTPAPEIWPWSSAPFHTGTVCAPPAWLHDHVDYWACGNTPFERQARYRQQLQDGLSAAQVLRIEQALSGQWALGSLAFIARLTHTVNRRATPGKRGRPRKILCHSSCTAQLEP